MKTPRPKLTFANVVSCLALFVALGGSAYAASQLPKNSVGAKQLKINAVTPAKISAAAKSSMTGATGPQGPKGDPGAKGEEGKSFSAVVYSGSFAGAHKGFTAVSNPAVGDYCLAVEPGVRFYYPLTSVEWAGSVGNNLLVQPVGQENSSYCSAGELAVLTFTFSGSSATLSNGVNFIVSLPQD